MWGHRIGHERPLVSLASSPDNRWIASASVDSSIILWDAQTGNMSYQWAASPRPLRCMCFSPDGSRLLSGGDDAALRIWDVSNGHQLAILQGHTHEIEACAWSPDGAYLASVSSQDTASTMHLWDAKTSRQIVVVNTEDGSRLREGFGRVCFSPDSRRVASFLHFSPLCYMWNVSSDKDAPPQTLRGHTETVFDVAFDRTGSHVATASRDRTIRVWDVETREVLKVFDGLPDWARAVEFSPDGTLLFAGLGDGTAQLWNTNGDHQPRILKGHQKCINAVAFSPDGQYVATASGDHTVRLWSISSRRCVGVLMDHESEVTHVLFSADGEVLASGDFQGIVHIRQFRDCIAACVQLDPPESSHTPTLPNVVSTQDPQLVHQDRESVIIEHAGQHQYSLE